MEPAQASDLPMFHAGRLSLAVDLYLQYRLFRDLGVEVLQNLRAEEAAAIIETFLKQQDLWDAAEEAFAEVQAARRISGFQAEEDDTHS